MDSDITTSQSDKTTTKSPITRKIFSWLGQLILFVVIFYAISWWQQRDMLIKGEVTPVESFSLLTTSGEVLHHNFTNGNRDTLIYFFAPWCSVCHYSIDNIESIYQSSPQSLDIIVVALDWRSIEEVDEFLAQHKLTMPVLLGTRKLHQQFQVSAFPSYYLISKDGKISAKSLGYSSELGLKLRLKLNRET